MTVLVSVQPTEKFLLRKRRKEKCAQRIYVQKDNNRGNVTQRNTEARSLKHCCLGKQQYYIF
jgi:hypothetical protein